jgi:hypothetical protein
LRFWKGKLFCFLTVYKYTAFCAKWQGNIGGFFSGFVTKCILVWNTWDLWQNGRAIIDKIKPLFLAMLNMYPDAKN